MAAGWHQSDPGGTARDPGISPYVPGPAGPVQSGIEVGERRVRRLMRDDGICGNPVRQRHSNLSPVDDDTPDLVRRKFHTQHPKEVWVTDLTEIKTSESKLWLCVAVYHQADAVVKDCHVPRRGWRAHARTLLALG